MGFLKNIVRQTVSDNIAREVGDIFNKTVQPKVDELTSKIVNMNGENAVDDTKVLAEWPEKLSQYPVWSCGGVNLSIEEFDDHIEFTACFTARLLAETAVKQYRNILIQNGFAPKEGIKATDNLYKEIDGTWYHVDTEHCFDSSTDSPTIIFTNII